MILVFHGDMKTNATHKPHESGKAMLMPLILLALGAVLSGVLTQGMLVNDFWRGSIAVVMRSADHNPVSFIEQYLAMIIALCGIALAYIIYGFKFAKKVPFIHNLLSNAYYFDLIYEIVFVKTIRWLSEACYKVFDNKVIDSVPRSLTSLINNCGLTLKALHRGNVQTYIVMFFGFIALAFNEAISLMPSFEFWIISLIIITIYIVVILTINQAKQTNSN
jgi:NADH-quinone oxidoreductase subunit L